FIVRILQFNFVFGCAVFELGFRVAANKALGLKNVQHTTTEGRSWGRYGIPATHLCVADTGQHIADWIGKAHLSFSLPARLYQTRDETLIAKLTQGNTAHLELAVVSARTTRHFTTVTNADLSRVAW